MSAEDLDTAFNEHLVFATKAGSNSPMGFQEEG